MKIETMNKIKYVLMAFLMIVVNTIIIINVAFSAIIIAPNDTHYNGGSQYISNYNYYPNTNQYYPNYNPNQYYTPNYNQYYDPNYNQYYNPNYNQHYDPNYNQYNNQYNYNPYAIPSNSYYYIVGYDRGVPSFSGGEAMVSRVPIIGGNYTQYVNIANNLVYGAYRSISMWCNNNILNKDNIQDYFLNYASIESETANEIIMIVNCSLKKKGIIDGNIEFRVTLNIPSNRYKWRKLSDNSTSDGLKIYEYDSDTGELIIIK